MLRDPGGRRVTVIGGGIAGLAAAAGLAERGVAVTLLEAAPQLGGRVRAWPVPGDPERTMSRGFHAFFRQYYNLRALLRRADPALGRLVPVEDYPLVLAGGHRDSFTGIPRTPPLNLAAFVLRSPSFTVRDLARVDVAAALELLDVRFPRTFADYDGESAAEFLDRLRFPDAARHLALEVFARSFFADPREFAAGELVAMFHSYFVGSAEGLLFDVPDDDYDTALWAPLARYLQRRGVEIRTGAEVLGVDLTGPQARTVLADAEHAADAVVLAVDPRTARRLVADGAGLPGGSWRDAVAAGRSAPPFAVWRLWLDRAVDADRSPFLGTSGYGPLDNVTVLERFEAGAARWAQRHRGSVVEVHAYAVPPGTDEVALREQLRAELHRVYPETAAAGVRAQEWLLQQDCPLLDPSGWQRRPGVLTPDPRLVLAGDWVRSDLPVALMERAATTGWAAANTVLSGWGVAGHDLWSTPMAGRHPVAGVTRRVLAGRPGRRRPGGQPGYSPRARSA
nr:FAD-dependent oxidoreductase [Nakamurella endophytica]